MAFTTFPTDKTPTPSIQSRFVGPDIRPDDCRSCIRNASDSLCTPDLSASACRDCLYNASGLIPQCCNARQGGRVIYPSCNFSNFEIEYKRNVVVIIVPIAGSVILIACICIFLRARKQKEEEEVKDLYEMEDLELLQLDFGTIREAAGNFSEFNKRGQGGFGVVYKSWRKWNEGTPLDIIDPNLNAGPRSEIMRSIHIGLVCVQENEALRPTMAQVSMMLSNYSVSLAAPSKPAFLMLGETSILPLENTSMLSESDEPRNKSPQWSNNELSISGLDPR
ncbi:hypothetical protein SADUNF_Sadunf11G0015200 [Salix dunnii]|uniref:Gnk2-homologous domain-containing protein n=1 Tax=Salix dunnii TaxID=1413687 RepID=A0A835JKZ8_9ROSI|nr:hypothetical protein SADUNF_Sadunf11G0015200 [Salix dunnii]